MNYEFPQIKTIEDVLPHVEGREEFIVAEREFGTVINYMVSMQHTFDMEGPHDLGAAIRRECRGIKFYPNGEIAARPFHKFFNVNEREETQIRFIDLSEPHVVMEKADGSMIHPILVEGKLHLCTKMGITDIAQNALQWAYLEAVRVAYLVDCVDQGVTPLFEWVGRNNQIVLNYEYDDLIYLGSRENVSGNYFFDENAPFTHISRYGSVDGSLAEYVERQRQAEGREGDVIRFANGQMLKIKNDWYVRIHKAMDRVRFDRNIVDLIVNEELDDVIPMMPDYERSRIRSFEENFWDAFEDTEERLEFIYEDASLCESKKQVALEFIPTLKNKQDGSFVFRMIDGHNVRELLLEHIRKSIGSNTKWYACAEWMGMSNA